MSQDFVMNQDPQDQLDFDNKVNPTAAPSEQTEPFLDLESSNGKSSR